MKRKSISKILWIIIIVFAVISILIIAFTFFKLFFEKGLGYIIGNE